MEQDVPYFALSYVWGTPNPNATQNFHDDCSRLAEIGVPEVIEDAMIVIISLGKRFL